jgi:hypothetical protein
MVNLVKGWTNFSIMMECTQESGHCHSACTDLKKSVNQNAGIKYKTSGEQKRNQMWKCCDVHRFTFKDEKKL